MVVVDDGVISTLKLIHKSNRVFGCMLGEGCTSLFLFVQNTAIACLWLLSRD